ncbi:TetR family transcriptional regulator [Streptomyces sp. TS71-3]|nr:TetR family transcriptional regulator [Streptomyces sp. TS71-3]
MDGAAACFARNGFHATSMQDVLREVNLSAGAVYRYFRGKDELIGAIVMEVLDTLGKTFEVAARLSPPPPPDVLLGRAMDDVLRQGRGFPHLIVQVWTETLRNPELSAVMREGYEKVVEAWVGLVRAYQEAGMMRADLPADRVARTMIATAQGFAAQQALFGPLPVEVLEDGLRALMSMGAAQAGPAASDGA